MNNNITLNQSSTFRWRIEMECALRNKPVDLSGATVFFELRNLKGELLANFTPYTSINTLEPHVIDIDAPASAAAGLIVPMCLYDIAIRDADGSVWRPLSGSAYIRKAISEVKV